jgi:hypothetical protein
MDLSFKELLTMNPMQARRRLVQGTAKRTVSPELLDPREPPRRRCANGIAAIKKLAHRLSSNSHDAQSILRPDLLHTSSNLSSTHLNHGPWQETRDELSVG